MLILGALLFAGCQSNPPHEPTLRPKPFQLRDLAKSDIDSVVELHMREVLAHLRTLSVKLYRRNPNQWRRTGKPSAEFVVERIFRGPRVPEFHELGGARGVDSIKLAFDPSYSGDRVLAFAAGVASMIETAYGDKREFFITDELDPQKLYNAARNVEVAAWLLESSRGPGDAPYLLGNSRAGEPRNLSFERQFGKIIAVQDAVAKIVAGKTNRTVRIVIQRIAGAVFLPL